MVQKQKITRFFRRYSPLLISSFLSAFFALVLYRALVPPREVLIRERVPVRYVNSRITEPTGSSSLPPAGATAPIVPSDFTTAAALVRPTVVNIKTIEGGGFGFLRGGVLGGSSGSGVIVSPDGLVITNNHVIEDGDRIKITMHDKREYDASLVGTDPSTDLALLQIDEQVNLPYLQFGNSDSLQIGEWVLAVGNPFNLESTVTAGIVSAKGRSIDILEGMDKIESFIQTDAAVNPGNSGGALVNTQGQLVGINTAIITRSGRYEGYSFAVPANLARKVILDLRDYGSVQRGLMGIFIDEVDSRLAQKLKLDEVAGVHINRLSAGGAAEDAGLKEGDVIIAINDLYTRTLPEMQEQVGRYRPGDTIKVGFIRKGKTLTTYITLRNKDNTTALIPRKDEEFLQRLGMEVRDISTTEARNLAQDGGVRVVSIYKDSVVDNVNMEPDFIITRVNGEPVRNVLELVSALRNARAGEIRLEGVYENFEEEYGYRFTLE